MGVGDTTNLFLGELMIDPENMTDEQLEKELLTTDFHGITVKRKALEELISRAERGITVTKESS